MSTVIEFEWPMSLILTSNQRLHWAQRSKRTKALRLTSERIARDVIDRRTGGGSFNRAHIVVTVTWPDKRRRDVHNCMNTIKAAIDGFVDAGLLPDDNDQHLIGPDLRVSDLPGVKGHVVLNFELKEVTV